MHRVKEQMSVYQRECTGYVHTAQETHKKSKHLCILSNNGPKGEAGMSGNDLIKTEEFMFQITDDEFNRLRSQIVTSNQSGGRRHLPYAFTEQGIAMLSTVLRTETAIKVSIRIINAFVAMRRFIAANAQIFDAYKFVAGIIQTAQKSITLIDNYIDDSVLTILTKRRTNVRVILLTKYISNQLTLDIKKFNEQYPAIEIKEFKNTHDRFIIIDDKTVYHFGASLKDLGKKWFAFLKIDFGAVEMLTRLEGMK
nr:conserved hypothetical protein [uncultured archaeon]CBH40097.1 conserved hypothetical protein [uncultured archaeon]